VFAPVLRHPHGQGHRLHAGLAHVAHDLAVGRSQHGGQRPVQFGVQRLAHFGPVDGGLDGVDHPVADDLGPQRVAFPVGACVAQHRADIGFQLPQFPFAGVGDLQTEPFGLDLDLDIVVLDQAQRVPVPAPAA
jgi:hypothetical protein